MVFESETRAPRCRRRYHPVHTRTSQLVLCWSEVGETLFSADHDGTPGRRVASGLPFDVGVRCDEQVGEKNDPGL